MTPVEVYTRAQMRVRAGKPGPIPTKVCSLDPSRLVLTFTVYADSPVLLSPSPQALDAGAGIWLSFGDPPLKFVNALDGPLTQCEWYAISTLPFGSLHIVGVTVECSGGGSGIDFATSFPL